MFYNGPDPGRYQPYEIRPQPTRIAPDGNAYLYRPTYALNAPASRDFAGFMQPELAPRYRLSDASDQGEELLQRLEQTGRVPSKDKFRRMACNTFIMTGACPYSDRCVFMHDFRIKADGARVRTTRQTKADNTIKDTFYWPDMTRKDIGRYLDAQGLPDPNQRYVIPESFASLHASFHNRGLYSLWNHFVEFCSHNNRLEIENKPMERDTFFQVSDYAGNRHIFGTYRLSVFVHLSVVLEERHRAKQRQLETSFASGFTTRLDSGNDSAYDFTSLNTTLNTTLNTPTKLMLNSNKANYSTTSPSITPHARNDMSSLKKDKLTVDTTLREEPPLQPAKQAPQFSLVIQPPDDEEFVQAPVSASYQPYRAVTTPTNISSTTRSTPITDTSYKSTTNYQVIPPMNTMTPAYPTTYPTNPNYSNYNSNHYSPRRAHSPRHPSFTTLRTTTAKSLGHYTPRNLSANTSGSYNSPVSGNNSFGAEFSAQRHYRPPTPRNAEYRASKNNNYPHYNVYPISNIINPAISTLPAESRDSALYADLLGEMAREGYDIQPPADTGSRETDWSHVHSSSHDSSHMVPVTQPIPVPAAASLPTMNTSTHTVNSALANNRFTRPVKTVNWADLNNSSSSDSLISDSDNNDNNDNIHRAQSEDWEQVGGDDHSASSISNSSTQSNASVPHTTNSVYDILEQAAAMSSDSTHTNNTDRKLSPWTDPTYLDLHLLGDSSDENDPYRMHDRGNIRALLGIDSNNNTDTRWPMDWAVSSTSGTHPVDDILQFQEPADNTDYQLDELGLNLSPIEQHSP